MFFSCFFWCFEIFLASLGKYVCMSVVHLGCTHFKEVMKKHCGRCLWVIKYDGYEDVCRALQFIYIYIHSSFCRERNGSSGFLSTLDGPLSLLNINLSPNSQPLNLWCPQAIPLFGWGRCEPQGLPRRQGDAWRLLILVKNRCPIKIRRFPKSSSIFS